MRGKDIRAGGGKIVRSLLASLLVLYGLVGLLGPVEAQAADHPDISGTCHISFRAASITDNLFYVTMPDGSQVEGYCIDSGLPAAVDGNYPFTGTWNGSSYSITVDSSGGAVHPTQIDVGQGCQRVGQFTWTPTGSIELMKESANKPMTDGDSCYSLAGAAYGVYRDASCTDLAATMVTDATGHAGVSGIEIGTYYVREKTASAGYALDAGIYPVEVRMSTTAKVNGGKVTETPKSDPIGMLVSKADATTKGSVPQGAASLEGAQFTVKWYAGSFASLAEAEVSSAPSRTWVFETDADGFCYFSDEYKVSGPGFFYQSDGKTATLPLGTAFITETKAPAGYALDDGAGGAPKTYVVPITDSCAAGESVHTYNSPVIPDSVQRGDYRLIKEIPTTNDDEDQELTRIPVEGVQFQVINLNDNAVVSPETLAEVGKDGVVCTIATDENGIASTRSIRPQGWTGALAYGSYRIHEVIPEDVSARYQDEYGITVIGVDDWEITVSADGQYDPLQIVANYIPQTPLCIQKVDSTTGKHIPLACSFQIFDEDGELVTYTDHMAECVIDTWTTVSDGHVTLPMKLDEGTYYIHEVAAPEGYVLGTEDVVFTVDEWRTWDDPIIVEYADAPIRAEIKIVKVDADGGEVPVAGAEYCVKAAEDIATGDGTVRIPAGEIVGYVTTDADGSATIEDLYLGRYVVYETKSPEGWALDTAEHLVDIESQGQLVPVVVENLELADEATTLRLLKVSAEEGSALPGAVFRIHQVEDTTGEEEPVLASVSAAGFDAEFTTDDEGVIVIDHLPHGTFQIEEIKAPAGYVIDESALPVTFKVDDQGFIGLDEEGVRFSDTLEVTIPNIPIKLDISKTDITSGVELDGAHLVLSDEEGNVVDEWVSAITPHRITAIEAGTYELTETIAPEGYLLSKETVTVVVEETGVVQKAKMDNDYTKVDISKTDIATGEELAGAKLSILDKEGNTVAEWTTEGKITRINGLAPGDYILREVAAPNGYEVAEDVGFTVQETGEIQKVAMQDKATPSVSTPQTGDAFVIVLIVLAIAGTAAVVIAVYVSRRKKLSQGKHVKVADEE